MQEMGITRGMYERLQRVAAENNCVIMIRKTNKGSVMPFDKRTAVGKKLATKGKSSAAFFTKGNITFLAEMAKKLEPKNWFKEQCTLIDVMGEMKQQQSQLPPLQPGRGNAVTQNTGNQPAASSLPKYRYVPKLITEEFVKGLKDEPGVTFELTRPQDHEALAAEYTVTIDKDIIAGKPMPVKYKLVRHSWTDINKEFDNRLVPPNNTDTHFYKVYVEMGTSSAPTPDSFPFIRAAFVTDPEQITIERILNEVRNRLTDNQRDSLTDNQTKFLDAGAPQHPTDPGYREVRVLALLTKAWTKQRNSGRSLPSVPKKRGFAVQQNTGSQPDTSSRRFQKTDQYKYFQVVADYDIFMIAPKISKIEEDEQKGLVMEINGYRYGVLPKVGSELYEERKGKKGNPYGLLSEFEIHVRNEINKALGTKVAQHGAEVANLFYTSDISDPVIAIYPNSITIQGKQIPCPKFTGNGDQVSRGPCFFMSLKMMIEMMGGSSVDNRSVTEDELNGTYPSNLGIKYSVDSINYTAFYGMLFNLNWGTEAYYAFNSINRRKDIEAHERSINQTLETFLGERDIPRINQWFSAEYAHLPISLKGFLVFLYVGWRRFTHRYNMRRVISREILADAAFAVVGRSITSGSTSTSPQPGQSVPGGHSNDKVRAHSIRRTQVGSTRYLAFLKKYYESILNDLKKGAGQEKNDALIVIYEKAIEAVGMVRQEIKDHPHQPPLPSVGTNKRTQAMREKQSQKKVAINQSSKTETSNQNRPAWR
ncbi:MAG: hypothetical protein D6816_16510 [Bacteroidetes bacterium]|nr:MAG: hypothetical protein D6816_16510 [Bacteroidota bacterium]